jgi:hypothetical protein
MVNKYVFIPKAEREKLQQYTLALMCCSFSLAGRHSLIVPKNEQFYCTNWTYSLNFMYFWSCSKLRRRRLKRNNRCGRKWLIVLRNPKIEIRNPRYREWKTTTEWVEFEKQKPISEVTIILGELLSNNYPTSEASTEIEVPKDVISKSIFFDEKFKNFNNFSCTKPTLSLLQTHKY